MNRKEQETAKHNNRLGSVALLSDSNEINIETDMRCAVNSTLKQVYDHSKLVTISGTWCATPQYYDSSMT